MKKIDWLLKASTPTELKEYDTSYRINTPINAFPSFVEDYVTAKRADILSLKRDIYEIKELIISKEDEDAKKTYEIVSPILRVVKEFYKPNTIMKSRIISLAFSSLLAGVFITFGSLKALVNFWEGLYYIAFSIPAIGIAIACLMILFHGEQYDASEE